MRVINPMMKMGLLSTDPRKARAKQHRYLESGREAMEDVKLFRLFHGDMPCSSLVECRLMEANAWNQNARAFAAWQISLGREMLPILEWREEKPDNRTLFFRVRYKQNGVESVRQVYGATKADAKREFEKLASVSCRIVSIEEDEEGEA